MFLQNTDMLTHSYVSYATVRFRHRNLIEGKKLMFWLKMPGFGHCQHGWSCQNYRSTVSL